MPWYLYSQDCLRHGIETIPNCKTARLGSCLPGGSPPGRADYTLMLGQLLHCWLMRPAMTSNRLLFGHAAGDTRQCPEISPPLATSSAPQHMGTLFVARDRNIFARSAPVGRPGAVRSMCGNQSFAHHRLSVKGCSGIAGGYIAPHSYLAAQNHCTGRNSSTTREVCALMMIMDLPILAYATNTSN